MTSQTGTLNVLRLISRVRQWEQTLSVSIFLWLSLLLFLLCEYACLSVCHFLDTWLLDLQIYAVTPVSDISDVPQLERVPERIKSFYRINNVSRFHYDRPFHKGPKDRENEFRVRWASSATLCPFLPHSEILNRDVTSVKNMKWIQLCGNCSWFMQWMFCR